MFDVGVAGVPKGFSYVLFRPHLSPFYCPL